MKYVICLNLGMLYFRTKNKIHLASPSLRIVGRGAGGGYNVLKIKIL
jgi:hypothetical protein